MDKTSADEMVKALSSRLIEAERDFNVAYNAVTEQLKEAQSEIARLTAVADMYRKDRIVDNQKISEYKSKLKAALAERDEYYNRAVSMLYFIPSDSLVADLRKMYVDFKAWRAERLAMPEDK